MSLTMPVVSLSDLANKYGFDSLEFVEYAPGQTLIPGGIHAFDARIYVQEFAWRLNEGDVKRHTLERLNSFVDAIVGKRLTYARLIAKVPA